MFVPKRRKFVTSRHEMGSLRLLSLTLRDAFACVGWQVTLCDPIRQATPRSSDMGFH